MCQTGEGPINLRGDAGLEREVEAVGGAGLEVRELFAIMDDAANALAAGRVLADGSGWFGGSRSGAREIAWGMRWLTLQLMKAAVLWHRIDRPMRERSVGVGGALWVRKR